MRASEAEGTRCLVCSGPTQLLAHGVVAPFVCELAGIPHGEGTTYRRCTTCDLNFFGRRYSDEELAGLYGDYRSATYVARRRRWEPWYGAAINDAYATEGTQVHERRHFLEGTLHSAGGERRFTCTVDYGGDEGQFFPTAATGRRVVLEVSDRPLRPGVERVAALAALGERPDLVIMSHVLEHLPDPLAAVRDVRAAIAEGGTLYAEVPLDRFSTTAFHASPRYAGYLRGLTRHRWPFVAADLVTGLARQRWRHVPSLGVVKESEHLNYFSPRSLEALLAAAGFERVTERSDPAATVGGLRLGRHALVAIAR